MSFSKEMSDFVGAYTTIGSMNNNKLRAQALMDRTEVMRKHYDDQAAYDDRLASVKEDALSLRGSGSGAKSAKAASSADKATTSAYLHNLYGPTGKPATGSSGSMGEYPTNSDGTYTDENPSSYIPNQASGGMVAHAATGGHIQSQPVPAQPMPVPSPTITASAVPAPAPGQTQALNLTPAPPTPAPVQALPVDPAPAPTPAPTPAPSTAIPTDQAQPPATPAPIDPEATKIIVHGANKAIAGALKTYYFDPKQKAPGDDNKPGMTLPELEHMLKVTDPNNEMPAYLKGANALYQQQKFFLSKGMTKEADLTAAQTLVAYRGMTQTLGTLATHALESGDISTACKFFNDACTRFPSGHDVNITPDPKLGLVYSVSENGKEIERGSLPVAKFAELATGVADGSLYMQELYASAGQTQPSSAGSGGSSGDAPPKNTTGAPRSKTKLLTKPTFTATRGTDGKVTGVQGGSPPIPVSGGDSAGGGQQILRGVPSQQGGAAPVPTGTPAAIPTVSAAKPGSAPPKDGLKPMDADTAAKVNDVLKRGADPAAVKAMLAQQGFSTGGM